MSSANAVIVVSPEELARIVREAVREELAARAPEPASEWLDTAGASELIGVHRKTIAKLIRDEGLPVHRVGEKILRFSRPAVTAWMLERRTTGATAPLKEGRCVMTSSTSRGAPPPSAVPVSIFPEK